MKRRAKTLYCSVCEQNGEYNDMEICEGYGKWGELIIFHRCKFCGNEVEECFDDEDGV